MYAAITREKQLKAGSRARKIALIRRMNPRRIDLYDYLNTKRPFPSDIVCALGEFEIAASLRSSQ